MADVPSPPQTILTQKKRDRKKSTILQLKRGNNSIDDIIDLSSRHNPLPTQAKAGLITIVGKILAGMVVAVFAVFAGAASVSTGRSMLESSREFIEDRLPLCGDTVVTIPIRHGHAIRKHDGAALRVELVLGPSCLVRIILMLKL